MGTVGNAADGILHTGIDLFHLCLKVTGNIKGVLWRSRAQGGLGISDIAFYGNGGVIHKTYFCKGVGDRFLYEEVVGRQTQVGVVIRAKMPVRLSKEKSTIPSPRIGSPSTVRQPFLSTQANDRLCT